MQLEGDAHKNFRKLDELHNEMTGATKLLGVLESEVKLLSKNCRTKLPEHQESKKVTFK